jgi:hypothetical protein
MITLCLLFNCGYPPYQDLLGPLETITVHLLAFRSTLLYELKFLNGKGWLSQVSP